ncbi:MAG: FAD-dependent oxidoreductase [Propionibacteriaceae bacterium]
MAGARAVEEILSRGGDEMFAITMFGDEPYCNYNRIMLSHVLSGAESDADIYLNSLSWYVENGIVLHAGVRIRRIDRYAKVVLGDDGSVTSYDDLIIATGSRSFMPPMDGVYGTDASILPRVFAFRTIDDTRAMVDYATHDDHHRAVVIGGGLLGLDAARGLQSHGIAVDVVHSGRWLMNAQLGRDGGEVLRRSMAELGIGTFTNTRAVAIWGPDKVRGLKLRDETELACDLVVIAAGIRPNTDVATVSGLSVERAIVVDDQMRTTEDPNIYAVGECVQHRGEVYGLVAPLWEQAVVLADVITGANPDAAYFGSRTATKLKVAGVEVASMGLTEPERDTDEHIVFFEPKRGIYKSVIIRDEKIVGATLLGDSRKVAFLQQAFDRGLPLPEQRVELMFDLGGPSEEVGAAELADDAQVCNCNARFINDRVHANIQQDGTFSVVPQMRGGVTTPEQLRRIADVADKYEVPLVKLTGGQRIDLLGIKKEDLPKVWADLGMPSGYAYGKSFRTVKTCVGKEFCRFGTGDSTKLGIELETRLQGMESPAKMKLAVSGCPRNCAESMAKDVGIVAIEGGRWEIYVGGAAGAHIRKGDLLCTVDTAEEAKLVTGRFLQYYRENAKWLERTYAVVPRAGLDHIMSVVVDDSEGIVERLDAAVAEYADTYVDP